jgi:molybdate transport system permease protein
MGGLSASFLLLIVLLLIADLSFTSATEFFAALRKPEIQAAFRLTLLTCTVASVLSVWVATPLGYLLSRFSFPGRHFVDVIVDIPVVLPPLVLGLSLLILFHQPFPFSSLLSTTGSGSSDTVANRGSPSVSAAQVGGVAGKARRSDGWILETWLRKDCGFPVTYQWPAVILAQFAVSCAFAVRTMRVTFDQISPRAEDVARTLGCSRSQAFLRIALPQAWRGLLTAFTIAWARALGEFGPILVFAGATRFRTEVLSTSVFLELSVGQLDAAVAVSLMMVAMAVCVLLILRWLGTGLSS